MGRQAIQPADVVHGVGMARQFIVDWGRICTGRTTHERLGVQMSWPAAHSGLSQRGHAAVLETPLHAAHLVSATAERSGDVVLVGPALLSPCDSCVRFSDAIVHR